MPRKKAAGTSVKVTAEKQTPKAPKLTELPQPVKEVTVKVIKKYFDTKFNCKMPVGEGFEVTEKRAKELVDAKVAEIVKIVCLKN